MQIVDVPDPIAGPRIRGGWSDIGRAVGATHQLSLPLRFGSRHHRAFVLGRPDVFGRQDMHLAHLLRRLLTGVDRHLATLVRVRPELDVAADLRLTPRQLVVLGLLAEGHTAARIVRRLRIAKRTVRKHLEGIYAKLGVHDRLAAVLRARDTGLLP